MAFQFPHFTARGVLATGLVLAVLAACSVALLYRDNLPVMDEAWLRGLIAKMGPFGPLVLIGIMTAAIVVSPIPSGPIAIAAGAIYGTLYGAIYVIIGAVLGALLAFGIARYFGHDAIRKSDNAVLKYIAAPRSQWALMAVVFASRLVPFISFDAVSYAAGVTNLTLARFAIATIAGVVPVSVALAAMGAGMHDHGLSPMMLSALAGITLVPVIGKWLWDQRK
jgi:uncharacterized membrane protein YdjX (TVP38/TMEM64 family)